MNKKEKVKLRDTKKGGGVRNGKRKDTLTSHDLRVSFVASSLTTFWSSIEFDGLRVSVDLLSRFRKYLIDEVQR